jgi:peptidoglycan/xylan/chitin deacetylase (PgdA/CDA1 family)
MRERLHRTVGRLDRRRGRRDRSGPVVLLYHRLGAVEPDPQLLSVTVEHFAEHLELISERHVPLRLADVVAAAAEGRAPARAVAIAFDDGYADNLLAAKPLLEQRGMPATVFVASGHVQNGQPFWWDELERLLLRPGRLPSVLTLEIRHETLTWNLDEDAAYASDRAEKWDAWTVFDARDPGQRHRIYRALCSRLRLLDHIERDRALEQLRSVAAPEVAAEKMPRPLAVAELARLAEGDLIEVGAHSVTHPVLAQLPPERQREEVADSKRQLEEIVGRPVNSFAYPFGTSADFDETTVRLVREAGFARACANVAARLNRRTDPFRIPRVVVRNCSSDELARRLAAPTP